MTPEEFAARVTAIEGELGKVIVGQEDLVRAVVLGMLAEGHVLLEGVPGLGKTLLLRTLGEALNVEFGRVQFTPDLMPADIVGTNVLTDGGFSFHAGPVFANVVLADEVNRATPKTQSAMLETMQEGTVTIAGVRHELKKPFFVMATQNPIEQEGTYPLPEAQLDRFMFKLVVGYSTREELSTIVDRTTRGVTIEPDKVMDSAEIKKWQQLIREVILADHVRDYIVRLTLATHPEGPHALPITNQYLRWGASPRAAQSIALAAKTRALLEGRFNVGFDDVRRVFLPAMRHRVILNFEAQAEQIDVDQVLLDVLDGCPEKPDIPVASAVS